MDDLLSLRISRALLFHYFLCCSNSQQSGRCTPCAMVFLALPSPPTAGAVADVEADATYMRDLDSLSAVADMPALAFIRAATDRVVVTTEI